MAELYTLQDLMQMGILPFRNIITLRRMARAGIINVVRTPTPKSHMFVTKREVHRLKNLYVQDVGKAVETK